MKAKLLAVIKTNYPKVVHHFVGPPPELVRSAEDTRHLLEPAAFITLQEDPDGIFLFRFDVDGRCVGDTWHRDLVEAKEQAVYEYGESVGEWIDVSVETETLDVIAVGLKLRRALAD